MMPFLTVYTIVQKFRTVRFVMFWKKYIIYAHRGYADMIKKYIKN